MIKANVKFFGQDQDKYGLPKPYFSYLVVSSPWQVADSGVATVFALSSDAPIPNPPHKLVLTGGADAAFEEMMQILRSLPDNEGLKELIHKEVQ